MVDKILPDDLWHRIEPLLPRPYRSRKTHPGGRPRTDDRKALTGIIFVLRTGVPWRELPATDAWPSGYTCRRRLVKWYHAGVWNKLFHILLSELRSADKLDLSRAVVDSGSVRAPSGGRKTGPSPTDRRKIGTKHHVITDADGTPLAVLLTGANRHDVTQLLELIESIEPIAGKRGRPQKYPDRVLGDRAYDSEPHRKELKKNAHSSELGKTTHRARQWPRKTAIRSRKNHLMVPSVQKS